MAASKPRLTTVTRSCVVTTLLILPLLWPVLRGETIFLRDIGTTHRPAWAQTSTLGLSKINPAASFGQPYRGNPNLLLFYPFPKSEAGVEAHVVAHLLLLAVGMAAWLHRSNSSGAAIAGALCFTLSGYVLSASSSLNSLTTIAWMPWIFVIATTDGRARSIAVRALVLALLSVAGEPVLILGTLAVAFGLAWRSSGKAGIMRLLIAGAIALVLTAPIHRETLLAALDSHRVVQGYGFREAADSIHPARMIELLMPGFFGTPSRIAAGSWWGYAVSHGKPPYVFSVFVGIVSLMLLACFGMSTRWRTSRGWWGLLVLSGVVAASGYLPGAAAIWDALPFLHVIRFPVKAYLFATLALAVLTSRAWDHFSTLSSSSPERRRVARWVAAAAALVFVSGFAGDRIAQTAISRLWNPQWLGDAAAYARWTSSVVTGRLFTAVGLLLLLFFWVARKHRPWLDALLIVAISADLTMAGRGLVPTVKTSPRPDVSPLVTAARRADGRVFERAYKDLDVPIFGLLGSYPENRARHLAVAQARQAWALNGAMSGLSYAYDRSPDGSYTWRNHLLQMHLERASWEVRVKWLRGAAVATVIASNVTEPFPGLRPLARESAVGVPVTLYGIHPRLRELRPVSHVRSVKTPDEAIRVFEAAGFDEKREIVVEGPAMPVGEAIIEMVEDTPDKVTFRSAASTPAMAFLSRSYTRSTRATAGGMELRVLPANVHLCAIELPRGSHTITVSF